MVGHLLLLLVHLLALLVVTLLLVTLLLLALLLLVLRLPHGSRRHRVPVHLQEAEYVLGSRNAHGLTEVMPENADMTVVVSSRN